MFVTGDSRGNETLELTVLQTLFLDNHNRIATELHKEHPRWNDEHLFQEARKINIAQFQSIVYNEWIPDVLGQHALAPYKGYNPKVNATIANEFSTVAFRFGHTLLSDDLERQGNNGLPVAADVPLAEDFFDPTILNGQGQPPTTDPVTGLPTTDIGAVLKGDADVDAQAEDVQAVSDVRNLLFNEVVPGVGFGQDLIALDIERARDNGIGSYNQVRVALGLPAVTSFAQITSNVQVQHELQQAYGNVNNIDPFEGGVAEDLVPGSDCRSVVPDDHGQPVHTPQGRGPLLLPERAIHSERAGHPPAGQHPGQGHRGEHRHHQPPKRRLYLPGLDQRNGGACPRCVAQPGCSTEDGRHDRQTGGL